MQPGLRRRPGCFENMSGLFHESEFSHSDLCEAKRFDWNQMYFHVFHVQSEFPLWRHQCLHIPLHYTRPQCTYTTQLHYTLTLYNCTIHLHCLHYTLTLYTSTITHLHDTRTLHTYTIHLQYTIALYACTKHLRYTLTRYTYTIHRH